MAKRNSNPIAAHAIQGDPWGAGLSRTPRASRHLFPVLKVVKTNPKRTQFCALPHTRICRAMNKLREQIPLKRTRFSVARDSRPLEQALGAL